MRKNAAAVCAVIGLIGFASAAQAGVTVTWTYTGIPFSTQEQIYDHVNPASAHPTDLTMTISLYSYSGSYGSLETHMNTATAFDPLGTLQGSAVGWGTDFTGAPAAAGSANFDATGQGIVGDLLYFYLLDPGATHSGYVLNSNWLIPDDSITPQFSNLSPGRVAGDAGTTGTLPLGGAVDGWATTNVPEPGSIMLFAAGLAAIVLRKRLKS